MLAWLKSKKRYKVFVRTNLIEVAFYNGDIELRPAGELRKWLVENNAEYQAMYNEANGERWLQFKDQQLAIYCKMVFG